MKQLVAFVVLFYHTMLLAQPPKTAILFKLQGHSDDLECMAISGNGKLIASGSWDGIVNLFSTDSNYTPLATFSDHFSAVNSIAFTNNGKTLVTAGNDGKIFTYVIDSFGIITKDKSSSLHRMSINAVGIDPGGKFVYTGSNDGTMIQYELAKNKERKINNTNPISSIAIGSDRKTIYCSDNTSTIKKYDMLNANIPVVNYEGHTDQVNCIVLSKDNKFLVSASSDKTIKIWNTQTSKLEKTLIGHDWKVITLAISANGKYIVSGSNDGTNKLWDIETGKELRSFDDIGTNVRGVGFSNDNSRIYTAMNYPVDSFETKGILAIASGIEKPKKDPPKLPNQKSLPKGLSPKGVPGKTNEQKADSTHTKELIKKTDELEISEEKKKTPEPNKNENRPDRK